jgi:LysM repeat protein
MTWKQAALLVAVNAVLSIMITLLLVVVILPALSVDTPISPAPTATTVAEEETLPRPTSSQPDTTAELTIHVVQSGDTISGLALQYDVPGEDIIAANNLENPNLLRVGMQLIIPVSGVPQVTPTLTPVPTPSDTPIPFEPPSAEMTATAAAVAGATTTPLPTDLPTTGELGVEISEIIGVGDVNQERVILTNVGERLADMQDWTLSDGQGNVYTFINFRLWSGGGVTVHTRIGQDGNPPANFYWGKLEAVWSPGEEAVLRDGDGEIVSTYVVGR